MALLRCGDMVDLILFLRYILLLMRRLLWLMWVLRIHGCRRIVQRCLTSLATMISVSVLRYGHVRG